MYDSIRRLFSLLLSSRNRPDPLASNLLGLAARQQALFQVLIDQDKVRESFRYMVCQGIRGDGVVLACRGPSLRSCHELMKKEFSFRFLLQTETDKFPRLHKFQGQIIDIHRDMKTITVAIPANIAILEQRRNVRLKLQRRHLPGLSVWGLAKGTAEKQPRILEQRLLLDLTGRADEAQAILKNISAGGMRLALSRHDYADHESWLAKGGHLLVKLAFPGQEPEQEHDFEFVAKVSNTRVTDDPDSGPEIGVQFLSARGRGLKAHWRDVRTEGCLELLKLLQSYQLEYYRDLKKNLIMREESAPDPMIRPRSKSRGKVA
uniref:PilZ domain-containing protein n=1 Tax=Desulfovibrio sp. U5L TaxID=596152 RepID=I2Q6M6_9BACT